MSTTTPKKIGENQYLIEADSNLGMKVPVKIYADEELLQKMKIPKTDLDYYFYQIHLLFYKPKIGCSLKSMKKVRT